MPQLNAFLDSLSTQRQVLERQLEDLNATLQELAQYEQQCRALLENHHERNAA